MRRRLLSVLLASGAAFASIVMVAPPTSADTVLDDAVALSLSSYASHVVDEARGRIYVTPGPGDHRLVVTDLEGRPTRTVEDLTGAGAMALTDDGSSLFVALETHQVVRLDGETLAKERTYDLPDLQKVTDLAWAGGRVWVAARTDWATDVVFALDPATDERTPVPDLQGRNPRLTSTPDGHLLALTRLDEKLLLLDPTTGATTALRAFDDRVTDLRTSSTGQPYVITYGDAGYQLVIVRPNTLETVRSTRVTTAGATDTDAAMVTSATSISPYVGGVDVLDAETSTLLNRFRIPAWTQDERRVMATALTSAGLVVLHGGPGFVDSSLIADPSVRSSTLTLDLSPRTFVGLETTLTGTLTDRGLPIAGAEVRIADEPGGIGPGAPVRTRVVTTGDDGTFAFPYTPRSWNDLLTLEYGGDAQHPGAWQEAHGNFYLQPTDMSLSYPTSPDPGEPITFAGTLTALGQPVSGADIEVTQSCASSTPLVVRTDGAGGFSHTVTPGRCREDLFSFDYDGDATYEGLRVTRFVRPTWSTSEVVLTQPVEDAVVGSTFTWAGSVSSGGATAGDVPVTWSVTRGSTGTTVASGTTRTDGSGAFGISVTIDHADHYNLIASYGGDAMTLGSARGDQFQATRILTRVAVDDAEITVLPDEAVTIGGQVTTSAGVAVAGLQVDLWQDGSVMSTVETDAAGRFEFETVPRGLQGWADDGKRHYGAVAVPDSRYGGAQRAVLVTVAPDPTRLTLDDVPSPTKPGDTVALSGRLTAAGDQPLADRQIQLRHWDGEYHEYLVQTDEQGRFALDLVVGNAYGQQVSASFAGTRLLAEAYVMIDWTSTPLPGALTLDPVPTRVLGESIVLRGRVADLTGVGETTTVSVTRIDENGVTDWWAEPLRTAADGTFSVAAPADEAGRFTFVVESALWRVAAQVDTIVVDVRALGLSTRAVAPDASRRGWAVYEASRDPRLVTTTSPARPGLCVAHEVERLVAGTWRPLARTTCRDTGEAGAVRHSLDGRHPAGSRFRVRAVRESDTRTSGSWVRIRFR